MACPFFMPMEKLENGAWLHAGRLPLGCGWSGHCAAPGHEGEVPSSAELQEFCNLGYAHGCARLPPLRVWDSVRFGARTICGDTNSASIGRVQIRYVCERAHRPVEHGVLVFDSIRAHWDQQHRDARVQRMAECFVASYLAKRKAQEITQAAAS